jgi:hypothetical protein
MCHAVVRVLSLPAACNLSFRHRAGENWQSIPNKQAGLRNKNKKKSQNDSGNANYINTAHIRSGLRYRGGQDHECHAVFQQCIASVAISLVIRPVETGRSLDQRMHHTNRENDVPWPWLTALTSGLAFAFVSQCWGVRLMVLFLHTRP